MTQSFGGVNWVFAYDPAMNSWEERADMPTSRGACGVAVIDDLIYVAGGQPSARSQDFAVYDPATAAWRPLKVFYSPNH